MADRELRVGVLDSLGPWQPVIEEAVAGCKSQLRKLEGALGDSGGNTLDAFHTDAMNLYHLADELADRCQDVKLWRITE